MKKYIVLQDLGQGCQVSTELLKFLGTFFKKMVAWYQALVHENSRFLADRSYNTINCGINLFFMLLTTPKLYLLLKTSFTLMDSV